MLKSNVALDSSLYLLQSQLYSLAVLSQFLSMDKVPYYYYPPLWLASFGASLGITLYKRRKILASVRTRMKKSLGWPLHIKIINGLSWAGPFAAISVFHELYPYLILLGIGLGNMSTYFLIKTYSRNSNKEAAHSRVNRDLQYSHFNNFRQYYFFGKL